MYDLLSRRPSASMDFRLDDRTFCDMSPTDDLSSPNLLVPVIRSLMIKTFHLFPMTVSMTSTGHAGS